MRTGGGASGAGGDILAARRRAASLLRSRLGRALAVALVGASLAYPGLILPAGAAPGDLDSGFGTGGRVVTAIGVLDDQVLALALQPDGKIVAAGRTVESGSFNWALVRYNPDGTIDPALGGGDGAVTTTFGGGASAFGVAVQPDGKIVAGGTGPAGAVALARYDVDGTLDPGFGGGDGLVTATFGSFFSEATSVALQPDGRIVLAGSIAGNLAVFRFDADGTPDGTFGSGGSVSTTVGEFFEEATDVLLQPDGKIVTGGDALVDTSGEDRFWALVRYNADGTSDGAFGTGGIATANVGSGGSALKALALQPDGRIVAAGTSSSPATGEDFALARFEADGSLDGGFGAGGVVTTDFGVTSEGISGVALQPDGTIVAGGFSLTGVDKTRFEFAAARYLADGSPDSSFGSGGILTTTVGGGDSDAQALAIQPDGKILLGGEALGPETSFDFALVRYLGDPALPAVSIADAEPVVEGDFGTVDAVFAVTLSGPAPSPGVSVAYATADGTATAPGDYTPAAGSVFIPAGAISTVIAVRVAGDTLDEPNETFFVNLSAPVNAVLEDAQGAATIVDDDPATINNYAGGPGTIDRIALDVDQDETPLSRLCLDPRRAPCLDFTAFPEGPGPNPRTEQGVTFHVFDFAGVPASETFVVGGLGLDLGFETEIRLPPGVGAAELTLVPGTSVVAEAFYTDGSRAAFGFASPSEEEVILRLPQTPAPEVAQQPFAVAAANEFVYVADPVNYVARFIDPKSLPDPVVPTATVCPCETVLAGNGSMGAPADGADPLLTQLAGPYALDVRPTPAGVTETYIADTFGHRVVVVVSGVTGAPPAPTATVATLAGNGSFGFSGDGGPAAAAQLNSPYGVARDPVRSLTYVADTLNHRIRVIRPDGTIATVAGTGSPGFSGDGGPAAAAQLNEPRGLALDPAGNLYVADSMNHAVRRLDPAAGTIATVAGTGSPGFSGDGGPSAAAQLHAPASVALDPAGNLFVADTLNHRIRRVSGGAGVIATVAGNGAPGFTGDGGPAAAAQLDSPFGVAVRPSGELVIADTANNRVRVVAQGTIATMAGNGTQSYAGDFVPATAAQLGGPSAVAPLSPLGSGSLGLADGGSLVRQFGVLEPPGETFLVDPFTHSVRLVSEELILTLAGNGRPGVTGDGGFSGDAQLAYPFGMAIRPFREAGPFFAFEGAEVYVADTFNNVVRLINVSSTITVVVGDGTPGYAGDGGQATSARLSFPTGLAVDRAGNLYIADSYNARIRRVDPSGIITTVAGTGRLGFSGDGGPATGADLYFPYGVAVDDADPPNLYIADSFNHRIRRVDGATGVITTVAGGGAAGFAGDGGPATAASLNRPWSVAVDATGPPNLYVADMLNHRIRRVDGTTGVIDTFAAAGLPGNQGDLGPPAAALISGPRAVSSGVRLTDGGFVARRFVLAGDSFSNRLRAVGVALSEAEPDPMEFPETSVDCVACPALTLDLSSAGNVALAIRSVEVVGAHPSDFGVTADRCSGVKLSPFRSCEITVTFAPTEECAFGVVCRTAVLRITTNGADSPREVILSGSGISGVE